MIINEKIDGYYNKVYLDIISERNAAISKYSDVSPLDVTFNKKSLFKEEQISNDAKQGIQEKREIWYPVVDVALKNNMTGVLSLSGSGKYQINQDDAGQTTKSETNIIIKASSLEYWENVLMTQGELTCTGFLIRKEYSHLSGCIVDEIEFLSNDFCGKLIVWVNESNCKKLLFEKSINNKHEMGVENKALNEKERMIKALKDSIDYIIKSQIRKPDSLYYNGLYLFYDHDAKMFRQPSWAWSWGAAISTLLKAAQLPEIEKIYTKEYLYKVADEIGKASLRLQKKDDDSHPAHGLVFCRRDYDLRIKGGCMEFLSPPDSLFLAGWGWMTLYKYLKDDTYLQAARLLVDQSIRILQLNDDIIEQDYMIPDNAWKDWILDEAGFGMKGFAELYDAVKDEKYKKWGELYIQQVLNCFEREDGLWNRLWTRSEKKATELGYHTRAMGWAMEGLLSSYQLLQKQQYLDKAMKMADVMISYQQEDGSWYFQFNQGAQELGISEKGTPYWSILLFRLFDYTQDKKYEAAAKKALSWCMNNQYVGQDADGYGGIIGITPSSGVVYRRFFPLSCTYTSSFFGDALLRAL